MNNAGQKWYEAIVTFVIILVINILLVLPENIPSSLNELYPALKEALTIAFILYAINKGIEWRHREAEA